MYEDYYGFTEKPFSLTPDPKYLYKSASHASAFELLQYAIRRREGFVVITGDIGTGKTTLCRAILEQMVKIGVESLPIVTLTNFFIGVVIAFQSAYQMQRVAAEIYIAALVSVSICREIGPIITGLVVAGRVGASIAAELGSMKVTEQIDALETLAANPVKYLVAPRFIALLVMRRQLHYCFQ